MDITNLTCSDDLVVLSREFLREVRTRKQFRDLMGAVLMANHVADWHFKVDRRRKEFGEDERMLMRQTYPEWDIIRQVANGTKHCKLKVESRLLEWEDADWWSSPGHVGDNWNDWFVDVDGIPRSIAVLIEQFLDKFEIQALRPL